MIVNLGEKTMIMNREQFRATLSVAKDSIPHGIYAIEKNGTCVLVKRRIESEFYLRRQVKALEEKGFKVYWNK